MTCTLKTEFATAERAGAAEIEASFRSLADSELMVKVLDALPHQVMILNQRRQITYGNAAALAWGHAHGRPAIVGLRPGEMLGCDVAALAPAGCGTAESCRNCGAAKAILGALDGRKGNEECRLTRTEASLSDALDLRVCATPFQWRGREHVVFVACDIADEKRRQVLERVFFHDIMNTAGGIMTMAEMLSTGDLLLDEVKDDLTTACNALMHEITSQRVLVAAENNVLAVQMTPMDSDTFLGALAQTFRNHRVAHGRHIRLADDSAHVHFTSDEALLSRVVGNLLKNALEASPEGRTVTLACAETAGRITFTCHNEQAMPREIQLQVFQRSFSTKGRDRGIGTYSIKLLTERYLGGKVSFTSTPEAGTVFSVELPA